MMPELTVTETSGGWSVIAVAAGVGVILKTFATNAEAWRWIDRRAGDIVSRSEAVSEWVWQQEAKR